MQLKKIITSLIQMTFEMANGTHSKQFWVIQKEETQAVLN
jgi:hypothetical protein